MKLTTKAKEALEICKDILVKDYLMSNGHPLIASRFSLRRLGDLSVKESELIIDLKHIQNDIDRNKFAYDVCSMGNARAYVHLKNQGIDDPSIKESEMNSFDRLEAGLYKAHSMHYVNAVQKFKKLIEKHYA